LPFGQLKFGNLPRPFEVQQFAIRPFEIRQFAIRPFEIWQFAIRPFEIWHLDVSTIRQFNNLEVGKLTVDKFSFDNLEVGKVTVDEFSFDNLEVGEKVFPKNRFLNAGPGSLYVMDVLKLQFRTYATAVIGKGVGFEEDGFFERTVCNTQFGSLKGRQKLTRNRGP
jgi:hypothetical protein